MLMHFQKALAADTTSGQARKQTVSKNATSLM